jgi:ABC-type transport system involved in multi-copper enzyme maturation permease subunit
VSFTAIIGKELGDLLREKRFGGWVLAYLAFWTFMLFMFLEDNNSSFQYRRDYPQSLLTLAMPSFFILSISFVVLALFVLTDGITKERESGMLPVVGAKPIARWQLVFAKLLAGLVVYVGALLFTLLPAAVMAASLGTPLLGYIVQLFALPFLALYLFILGAGLLMGVAFSSSKVAIGTGAAVYIPLFLVMRDGPLQILYRAYPSAGKVAAYTPFQAAYDGTTTLAYGGVMPWGPLAVTAAIGLALAGIAFWTFHRQEVAA